jgi:protein-tyrosine-phosphatase
VATTGEPPGAVLFACSLNAVRSPMAAAMLAHFAGVRVRVASAGVRAGMLDPYMVAVMDEIGIDLSAHEPRSLDQLGDGAFDLIVTLSPEAHHHALELTRTMAVGVEYWPTLDATAMLGHAPRQEMLGRYRQVRDGLLARIKARFAIEGGPTV